MSLSVANWMTRIFLTIHFKPNDASACYKCASKELIMRPEGGPETSICVAGCGVVDLEPIAKELYGNSTTETIHVFVQGL